MWELGEFDKLGPKGRAYVEKKYGTGIDGDEPSEELYDEYESPFDIEIEY
jgi:hypothetical protein